MAVNTRTIGQYDDRITLITDDKFLIQVNNGIYFHTTSKQISTFVGSIPFNSLKFNKIAIPADPPLEEGIAYLREIDANNNGLFIKLKQANVIVEVQIA